MYNNFQQGDYIQFLLFQPSLRTGSHVTTDVQMQLHWDEGMHVQLVTPDIFL